MSLPHKWRSGSGTRSLLSTVESARIESVLVAADAGSRRWPLLKGIVRVWLPPTAPVLTTAGPIGAVT